MTDVESLIAQMTLEEKAALATGASAWTTVAIPRLGVPAMTVSDGPHGLRHPAEPESLTSPTVPATCFPTASALAASWDPELLRRVGEGLAEEAIALGVDVVLGPGVNMKRSPLGGRNFEYYSEDPYLAGELAVGMVNGLQGKGVGASVKHFAANNQEFQRFFTSAEVDERTLREIYLPAFETVVKRAKPWTVMCAYNKVNGTYCSEHGWLLKQVLKSEWGFEGLVVSDWGAVHDRVAALRGGLDLEMPGPQQRRVAAVVAAVRSGELEEAELDDTVRRILRVVFAAAQTPKGGTLDVEGHHALARQAAAESMVLLKNNGLLPLSHPRHIAVIGRGATAPHFQGGGSSHVEAIRVDVPLEELRRQAGDAEVTYAEGYPADGSFQQALIDEAVAAARAADVALLYVALPEDSESEGYDRTGIDLSPQQVALIQAVGRAQPATAVILNNGAPVAMSAWIDDVAAVLEAWLMGQAGGGAIADILFGKANPSGKLAESFPLKLADNPAYINWPGNREVRYGEGIFIGYRYYDAKEMDVLFPFGYGLSYTTFSYSHPRVSASTFRDVDGVTVSVDVTNTGSVAGKEIVQVYVHDRQSDLARPPKELKGFAKVELRPGETKTVSIPLDFRAFAYYHPRYAQWITEDGDFDLLIGASSRDIRCQLSVTLQSTVRLPSLLDQASTLREWMGDPNGRRVLEPLMQQALAQISAASGDGGMGMNPQDLLAMAMDMPLSSLLNMVPAGLLPMPPDDLINGLLAQARTTEA